MKEEIIITVPVTITLNFNEDKTTLIKQDIVEQWLNDIVKTKFVLNKESVVKNIIVSNVEYGDYYYSKKSKIEKNNALLAKYEGYKPEIWKAEDSQNEIDCEYWYHKDYLEAMSIEDFTYHSNWESLNIIINKLNKDKKNPFNINKTDSLSQCYNLCVQVVKWLNSYKKIKKLL